MTSRLSRCRTMIYVSLAALNAWLRSFPELTACEGCDGSHFNRCLSCSGKGTYRCECECGGCEGVIQCTECKASGRLECDECVGVKIAIAEMFGIALDRAELASGLSRISTKDAIARISIARGRRRGVTVRARSGSFTVYEATVGEKSDVVARRAYAVEQLPILLGTG